MLISRILTSCYKFCRITPQSYKKISQQFIANPKMQILQPYFKSDNIVYIYNLIKNTPMKAPQKIIYLNQIQQKLCRNNSDVEFNILANLHNDKCKIHMEAENIGEALFEIQRALQSIRAMQRPYNIEVIYLLLNAADVNMNAKLLPKAQKFLKQAQHLLDLTQQQIQQIPNQHKQLKQQMMKQLTQMQVRMLFQFCKLYSMTKRLFQANDCLKEFFEKYQQIQQKNRDQLLYLLAIRYKCIFHSELRQQNAAIQTADSYLQKHISTSRTHGYRMWLMKFLINKGINKYQGQLKKNIQDLSKLMSQQQLSAFLTRHGVISKKKAQNTAKDSQKSNKTNKNKK